MNSAKFKKIRERCGLSQEQMADKLGVNQSQISRWERNIQPIPAWVDKLVDCFKKAK